MPKVRDSSGTMGTTREPISLSRTRNCSARTAAMVVAISRSPVLSSSGPNVSREGTVSGGASVRRTGR